LNPSILTHDPGNSVGSHAHYLSVSRSRATIAATGLGVTGLGLVAMLSGYGSSTSSGAASNAVTGHGVAVLTAAPSEPSGSVTAHGMSVTGAFVPLPASPSVGAAYLELHNLTGKADTLVAVSTPVAARSMAMSEGANTMVALGPVKIPAHGRVSFTPGHDHLMLQGLTRKLKVGEKVTVSLRFTHAGVIRVVIPVVPLDRILGGLGTGGSSTGGSGSSGSGSSGSGGSMAGMAGM
jgi:copper(I)-binding protein